VSLAGTSLGFLLMGFAQTLPVLFLGRIIDGITGGNISTAQAYIADITPPSRRSKRMGLIGAAFGLGFIFGPAIGGILGHISMAAPFVFAAALAACNTVAAYFLLPESLPPAQRGHPEARAGVLAVFTSPESRGLKPVLATYFFTTVAFSMVTATYPLFTRRHFGYSAMENGYIFAGLGLLGALVQGVLMGPLTKWTSDKALTMLGTMVLIAGLAALPSTTTSGYLLAATGLIGVGHGLVAAPLNGLASRRSSAAAQGRVLGLMQSAASMARIVGPVLGGWLLTMDAARPALTFGQSAYWTASGLVAIALVLAAYL
jgi:DHA1 family tetracycline resistance protein-like MFS transporter